MEYKNLTLSKLLSSTPILCELLKKVEELTKLNQVVLKQLDPKFAKHCRVQSYENGILTISTNSPAWGHTLRFAESDLLSHLRSFKEWCGLKSVRSRVVPCNEIDTFYQDNVSSEQSIIKGLAPIRPTPTITKKDAELLRLAANTVTSASLREALLKLATRRLELGSERP